MSVVGGFARQIYGLDGDLSHFNHINKLHPLRHEIRALHNFAMPMFHKHAATPLLGMHLSADTIGGSGCYWQVKTIQARRCRCNCEKLHGVHALQRLPRTGVARLNRLRQKPGNLREELAQSRICSDGAGLCFPDHGETI